MAPQPEPEPELELEDEAKTASGAEAKTASGAEARATVAPDGPRVAAALKTIGSGAYGTVFALPDRRRCLKRCDVRDADDLVAAMWEMAILSQVRHKHIIRVYQFEATGRDWAFTAERGTVDLSIALRRKALDEDHATLMLAHIAAALRYLHSLRIVHLDIKPANIIWFCDAQRFCLCDFGLAWWCGQPYASLAAMGARPHRQQVVTRYYRAPELLATPGWYDAAVDIWALGCVYVEALVRPSLPLFRAESAGGPTDRDVSTWRLAQGHRLLRERCAEEIRRVVQSAGMLAEHARCGVFVAPVPGTVPEHEREALGDLYSRVHREFAATPRLELGHAIADRLGVNREDPRILVISAMLSPWPSARVAAPALCDMLETAGLAEAVVDPAEGTAAGLILPPSYLAPDTDIAVFLERSVASANASLRDSAGSD